MKKISIAMFSIIAMAGVASAQGKGSAAAAPKADAKAATGAAAGSAAAPKADAKAAPAPAMEMPKPAPEIAAALKEMGAHKNCTGTGMGGPDMKTELKFKASMTNKSDLGGYWNHMSLNGTMGEGKGAAKFMLEQYTTYDAKMGKWRVSGVMNDGGNMAGTADMKDGKYESQADVWTNMGKMMMKEHGDMTDKKAGAHMWGEASMDGGKTWMKVYDMTCK